MQQVQKNYLQVLRQHITTSSETVFLTPGWHRKGIFDIEDARDVLVTAFGGCLLRICRLVIKPLKSTPIPPRSFAPRPTHIPPFKSREERGIDRDGAADVQLFVAETFK